MKKTCIPIVFFFTLIFLAACSTESKPSGTVNYKSQFKSLAKLNHRSKDIYQSVFSKIVNKTNPAIHERIIKAIDNATSGFEIDNQRQRVTKSLRTAIYSEIRMELQKENMNSDYISNLFDGIAWVVKRRSDMVENSKEFVETPYLLLNKLNTNNTGITIKFQNFMNNVFAMSFAFEIAHFTVEKERNNNKKMALKLLEAQLYFESILHIMEDADTEIITIELNKTPADVNIDLILTKTETAYPKIREYYNTGLSM